MDSKTKARRGLIVFFAVLIAGSAYFEHKILVLGGSIEHHLGLIFSLMWWVAVSSIAARLVLGESPPRSFVPLGRLRGRTRDSRCHRAASRSRIRRLRDQLEHWPGTLQRREASLRGIRNRVFGQSRNPGFQVPAHYAD